MPYLVVDTTVYDLIRRIKMKIFFRNNKLFAITTVFLFLWTCTSIAQEGFDDFDDEPTVVLLKKIRDDDSNYLRDVTRSIAREINKTGEFVAKPYKNGRKGAVIDVRAPQFDFVVEKSGLSASEMASTGLSIAADIGSIFGRDEDARKAVELNNRLQNNKQVLDQWSDNEDVKVTMHSQISLFDSESGKEVNRTVKYEKVFNNKADFLAQKESIIQASLSSEIKKALVEFLEDDEF